MEGFYEIVRSSAYGRESVSSVNISKKSVRLSAKAFDTITGEYSTSKKRKVHLKIMTNHIDKIAVEKSDSGYTMFRGIGNQSKWLRNTLESDVGCGRYKFEEEKNGVFIFKREL